MNREKITSGKKRVWNTPVEVVWLRQMFAVMDFPRQVFIHHDVIVPLLPHFIVPVEDSTGFKFKHVTR